MGFTLRTKLASFATTKGSALDSDEHDDNLIGLKAEIDSLATTLAAVSAHAKNGDTYLAFGTSNQVSAADLKVLLDDIPLPSTGSQHDELRVNSGATAYVVRKNAYLYAYSEDAGDTTAIASSDSATSINITLTDEHSNNLSSASGAVISNSSGETLLLEINAQFSIFCPDAADATIELIAETTAGVQKGRCTTYNHGGQQSLILTWCGIVSINDGDSVEFKYINVTGSEDIRTDQAQLTAKSIN